jgi:hypothetical protein
MLTIGTYRREALVRVLAAIWLLTVGAIISLIFQVFGIIYGVVDIIWQLIANSDGLRKNGSGAMWFKRGLVYLKEQTLFVVAGKHSFELLP